MHYLVLTVSVDFTINVISARGRTFSVSCTSTGGVATWGRINGLGIAPVNLEPVGTLSRRGDDMFSATSPVVTVTLGEQVRNGTIYSCHAGNEASEDNSFFALQGVMTSVLASSLCLSFTLFISTEPHSHPPFPSPPSLLLSLPSTLTPTPTTHSFSHSHSGQLPHHPVS